MAATMATMEDCTCPICLCILIEPVTMPCKHSICFPCYKQTVEKANLCCPLCRLRISVWARKSAKAGTLIDGAKWAAIKKEFPVQVQKRLEGKETLDDDDDLENYEIRLRQLMAVSKPGEIREEYEAELQKLQRRRQEEAKMEEEASAALIRSLQQEEEREKEELARLKEEQDMMDREIAEKLQETFVSKDDEAIFSDPEASTESLTILERSSKSVDKKAASKIKKGKGKQLKQASSNNLTMATFFSPVPRETGPRSPICGNMAPRKLHIDYIDDANLTSPTFLCDRDSDRALSQIPALETEGSAASSLNCLEHKHPEVNVFVKSCGGDFLEDPAACGGGVVCGTNLSLKTLDRFAAGSSGLGRYGTVTSFRDLRTPISSNAAKEIAHSKHSHTMPQKQPFEICNRVSATSMSSCSVSAPSGHSLAAGANSAHFGLASSRAKNALSIRNRTLNSGDSQHHTQPAHSSDTAERCSSYQKASVLSHRKNFENFSADVVESNMSYEGAEPDSQETLLADSATAGPGCKNETTASDHVKWTGDPASVSTILSKWDDRLTESGDGITQKCTDTVNGWALEDDVRANDSDDSIISSYNDMSDSDSCTDFSTDLGHSRQETRHKASMEKQSKTCLVKSQFNSEKENRIGIDSEQYKDVKINFQGEGHHQRWNPTVKMFRVKTHSAKKPKKSVVGKKTEPAVSIMRWCVPNDCPDEPENGLQTKNAIVDKLEPRHRNDLNVLNYFGKRKDTTDDGNETEHVFEDKIHFNHIHNVNRDNFVADDTDEFSRKKKRLKNDSVNGRLASVGQETSVVDVVDLDSVDPTGMSQEDLDHLMAVRLQEMYSSLDKNNIAVDRFKGSKDQYMLRKKSARK